MIRGDFAIRGLVEDEIGVLAAVIPIAFLRKQALAQARALDGLEILLGNDRVGIDIDHSQRSGDAFECGELLHSLVLCLQGVVRHSLEVIVSFANVASGARLGKAVQCFH